MDLSGFLTPALGVYTITIRSEYNGFAQWYIIHVERAPDAVYTAPQDYVLVSSNENVGPAGVAMSETYMPRLVLDIQKLILIYPVASLQPPTGPSANVPVLGAADMKDMAENALNMGYIFNKLMTTVGGTGAVNFTSAMQAEYAAFGDIFVVPPEMLSQLLSMQRCTPQSIMLKLYQGLGLMLVQSDQGFELTDLNSTMAGAPEQIEVENIVSLSTAFDYRHIPKTQTIHFDAADRLTENSSIGGGGKDAYVAENVASNEGKYAKGDANDGLIHRNTPGAAVSQAVGTDINIMPSIPPLLAYAGLNGVVAGSDGMVTLTLPNRTEQVQLAEIKKTKDSMKTRKRLDISETDWDYSAAQVMAKRMFMENMQKMMSFQVIMASTSKNAVVDGVAGKHFGNLSFSGGEIALQKAIIEPTGVTHETETGSLGDGGFVTGLTVTLQAGITTSTITYINLTNAYQGVF